MVFESRMMSSREPRADGTELAFDSPFWHLTERFDGTKSKMEHAVRIMDDFAYGIIAQREIEGRDGKNSADTDVSYGVGLFSMRSVS